MGSRCRIRKVRDPYTFLMLDRNEEEHFFKGLQKVSKSSPVGGGTETKPIG